MPVNLIEIQKSLPKYADQAKARRAELSSREWELMGLIEKYAGQLDAIKARVNQIAETNDRLRCAVPLDEPLDAVVPMPPLPERFTLLASDGSQINPSRHTQVPFGVINVAVLVMTRGSGETPRIFTDSELLDYNALFPTSGGMMSEGEVAIKRDLLERSALADFPEALEPPTIAMVDGPLELIREPQAGGGFEKVLEQYEDILARFMARGLIILGYTDKSQSDLVGRMMELMRLGEQGQDSYDPKRRQFAGLSDRIWLRDRLVNPGDRSAVFAILSETNKKLDPDLSFHFFYLNVGQPGKPHLARVEVPGWVAKNSERLGFLQAALTEQAHVLGTRPYPYLLHRAHEEAVVTRPEHQYVEDMIVKEFLRQGIPMDEASSKQYHKDLDTTKKRYNG